MLNRHQIDCLGFLWHFSDSLTFQPEVNSVSIGKKHAKTDEGDSEETSGLLRVDYSRKSIGCAGIF
jgi:hypothetical protein